MTTVSAVMPIFNRERFLAQAIESVLAQTYPCLELLLIDDGSTDGSIAIAEGYASRYSGRIRLMSQAHQGPSRARNRGVEAARGDVVAFIDSDDFWATRKLERQMPFFAEPRDVAFVYSGYFVVDELGTVMHEVSPDPEFQGRIWEKLWTRDNAISGGTMLVPRDLLRSVGGFDESLQGAENLDLRIRLSKLGDVQFVDESLYYYRRHTSNLSSQTEAMESAHGRLIAKHSAMVDGLRGQLRRRAVARHYYRTGAMKFQQMDLRAAVPHFLFSLWNDPSNFDCYVRLARCGLGRRVNRFLSRAKSHAL